MAAAAAHAARAQAPDASAAELAKKLANPVSDLISVPFQNNWDWDLGPSGDGFQYKLNFQPVIPVSISRDWNLISRTIVPVIDQQDVTANGQDQSGFGDTSASLFFSPKNPTNGWIWGVGPIFLLPTATDGLGSNQWGAGPTAVVLRQQGPWTYGMLANQVWSINGAGNHPDVNALFLQPFLNYTTAKATSFTLNTESTYDWEAEQWTAPINLMVAQMLKPTPGGGIPFPVQAQLGLRYYVDKPPNGPDWGIRINIVALFPTGKRAG
ncbi:transporter [Caulobacter sp. 17J80-11]|nr:transporter [Caulobacter sp. 17J80-11]